MKTPNVQVATNQVRNAGENGLPGLYGCLYRSWGHNPAIPSMWPVSCESLPSLYLNEANEARDTVSRLFAKINDGNPDLFR